MGNRAKDLELDKYVDRAYGQLKEGIYITKHSGGIFKCPFCSEKRNQVYLYGDLMQHARKRGNSLMINKDLKQQGQHVALASYLAKYHGPKVPPKPSDRSDLDGPKVPPKPSDRSDLDVPPGKGESTPSKAVHSSILSKAVSSSTLSKAVHSSGKEMNGSDSSSRILKSVDQDAYVARNKTKKFVWPWKGIMVNIPKELKNGRYVGESGSKLKERLIEQGIIIEKVIPLWTRGGFSGCSVIGFRGDWIGFENAMRFQKSFEDDHHGKTDWYKARSHGGEKLYGWVATEEDCQPNSIIGKHLEMFDLKSVEDFEAEEQRKTSTLVSQLKSSLEDKDLQEKMMQKELQAASISIDLAIDERDIMIEAHNKEMSDIYQTERERVERVLLEHERMKKKIESQKKELKLHEKELGRREVRNENEKKELLHQQKMNEIADEVQKQVRENLLKLAEEQEKEKEALHKKSMELQKELDRKQALVLEVERLRGAVEVMKHMGDDEDAEVNKKKMESIAEELEDKEELLEGLEDLKQALVIKEHKASEELQEAMDALINGLLSVSTTRGARPLIGVKNLGELDGKPFEIAAKRKYSADMASEKAIEWRSIWQAYVRDTNWLPFKRISVKGTDKQQVIDEEDDRLDKLRNELGEEPYNEVVNVLKELIECGPHDRTPRLELWNFKEQRPSDLYEGVGYLLNRRKRKKT